MEKKFDFKTLLIASLLFLGFMFLIFYKYASADPSFYPLGTVIMGGNTYDADAEGNIITQRYFGNETDYNLFKLGVKNQFNLDLPSYSDVDSFSENAMNYFLSNVFRGSSEVVDTVLQGIDYVADLFQYLSFDPDNGEFVITPENELGLISEINHHIYNTGTDTVDLWRSLPQTIYYPYYSNTYPLSSSSSESVWVSVTRQEYNNQNRWLLFSSKDPDFRSTLSGYGLSTTTNTYTANGNTYYWVLGSQMYSAAGLRWGSSSGPEIGVYYNVSSALSALWGSGEPSSEPSLIPGLVIVDNPNVPLSLPAATYYNFELVLKDPENLDPVDPDLLDYWPENITYDVPIWLKDTNIVPVDFELPSDYDFQNIEFDYEVDSDLLGGAGLIQDVWNILPGKATSLIIFFGAGSLAFMFFRR